MLHYRLRTLESNSPAADRLASSDIKCQSIASITDSSHIARLHCYTSSTLQSKVEKRFNLKLYIFFYLKQIKANELELLEHNKKKLYIFSFSVFIIYNILINNISQNNKK